MTQHALIPLLYSTYHHHHHPPIETHHTELLHYPEIPRRAEIIREQLVQSGLVDLITIETPMPKAELFKTLDSGMVNYLEQASAEIANLTREDLSTFYSLEKKDDLTRLYRYPSVFPQRNRIYHAGDHSLKGRHGYYCFDKDAPLGKGTWEATLYSATLAHEGAGLILDGRPLVYALCRPPGHHASRDLMGGYCYFNNAAIAATRLLEMGTTAIIDVDYHHGNGTQEIFWEDPQVFFSSIHAHPDEEYPHFTGYTEETGGVSAPQTTLNFPLTAGTTEAQYFMALDSILAQVADFKPASVVISLGFDTFAGDPLGTFKLTHESYFRMGQKIAALNLPILLVQEGGYAVEALGELAEQFVRGLLA